jgi:very-short-patch-repair endonuclease
MRQTTKKTVAKARVLRRAMTPPEIRLWQILRTRPAGLKFRHQHPAGPYVLDFLCCGKAGDRD